jgi:hypothetical protein
MTAVFFNEVIHQVPGGPGVRRGFLALTGPAGRLGLARKSLVQTGQNFESPFQTVRFRARSKPDWPDYWDPCLYAMGGEGGPRLCTSARVRARSIVGRLVAVLLGAIGLGVSCRWW